MTAIIDRIVDRAKSIASKKDSQIAPGQPVRMSEGASVSDFIRQGDLYLIVSDKPPRDYVKVEKPKAIDKQLVPGNTEGAKHCLDAIKGATLYRPADWSPTYDKLDGPFFLLTEERTVKHPTHGDVTIPAGFGIQCRYQREFDAELRRERRNAD